MPYTVLVHGVPVACSTQAEAIALATALADVPAPVDRRPRQAPKPPVTGTRQRRDTQTPGWAVPSAIRDYFDSLKGNEQAVIRAIATAKGEIDLDTLATVAGLDKRPTSILLAACRTKAKKAGLDWDEMTSHRIAGAREARTSYYMAGPTLLGEATE
jgi:hypothetical protein